MRDTVEKIVVIGSSGAGKSVFARELGSTLKIGVFHLDRLFWRRGWKEKTGYERMEILEKLILERNQWIIEGNYLRFAELHVNAADTIIFLDISPLRCFWRLIKRHYIYRERSRYDIPEGCTDRLTFPHLLKVLAFPWDGKRIIKQTLLDYSSKNIIHLCSMQPLEEFLAQYKTADNNQHEASTNISPARLPLLEPISGG